MQEVTDATFQAEVLDSNDPVLVDFWAEWCQPCKKLTPVLEEIAAEHGGKLKFVSVDIEKNQQVALSQGVTKIPTLNIYQGGEVVKSLGAKPKPMLLRDLEEFLG